MVFTGNIHEKHFAISLNEPQSEIYLAHQDSKPYQDAFGYATNVTYQSVMMTLLVLPMSTFWSCCRRSYFDVACEIFQSFDEAIDCFSETVRNKTGNSRVLLNEVAAIQVR